MKPLLIPVSGGAGNPASITLAEALDSLRHSSRFSYLTNDARERLAEQVETLVRGAVIASLRYRDDNPDFAVSWESVTELLRAERTGEKP